MPIQAEIECEKCGKIMVLTVPDTYHTRPTRQDKLDTVKAAYRCQECGTTNAIYWAH